MYELDVVKLSFLRANKGYSDFDESLSLKENSNNFVSGRIQSSDPTEANDDIDFDSDDEESATYKDDGATIHAGEMYEKEKGCHGVTFDGYVKMSCKVKPVNGETQQLARVHFITDADPQTSDKGDNQKCFYSFEQPEEKIVIQGRALPKGYYTKIIIKTSGLYTNSIIDASPESNNNNNDEFIIQFFSQIVDSSGSFFVMYDSFSKCGPATMLCKKSSSTSEIFRCDDVSIEHKKTGRSVGVASIKFNVIGSDRGGKTYIESIRDVPFMYSRQATNPECIKAKDEEIEIPTDIIDDYFQQDGEHRIDSISGAVGHTAGYDVKTAMASTNSKIDLEMSSIWKSYKNNIRCWRVKILYGVDMMEADVNGSSDPYCILSYNGKQQMTKSQKCTGNQSNEAFAKC